jgi:surfeit locus 1 family protein
VSARRRWPAALALAVVIAGLLALGTWQVKRLAWKRALIAQVDRRLSAAPVAAPGPDRWSAVGRDDAYTRIAVTGRFLPGHDVRVQAVTDLGGGSWVLTPFQTAQGWRVLVNRGFVPTDASPAAPAAGPRRVTGLLRVTEPGGAFLRHNDPAANRWFSRDVGAIAASRRLGPIAPYFVDADGAGLRGTGWPRGGLTTVHFPNNHLVYAITWFALAALVAVMTIRALRRPGAPA